MRWSKILAIVGAALGCVAALAQTPNYQNLGRTPTAEEIKAWDTAVGPDGKELPPGSGTAKQGATVWMQQCAVCHGPTGAEGPTIPGAANLWPYKSIKDRPVPPLVGGKGTLTNPKPARTIGSFWPYATTLWDYINRAMPPKAERKLSANDVYGLTAFLLYQNGIVQENDVIDAKTLPKVRMPNRDGFIPPQPPAKGPWPEWRTSPDRALVQ